MKKLLLGFVLVIFVFNFSLAQNNKEYLKKNVRIYYNNINQELITKTFFNNNHNIFIEVYNITGSFIKKFEFNTNTQVFSNQLILKQGIYIFKVFDNETYYTKRVIVK